MGRSVAAWLCAVALIYTGSNDLDILNQALNVVQSIQLPFALIPIIYCTSRADIMGDRFVVQSKFRVLVYLICGALLAVNVSVFSGVVVRALASGAGAGAGAVAVLIFYVSFVLYLLLGPLRVYSMLAGSRYAAVRRFADRLGFEGVRAAASAAEFEGADKARNEGKGKSLDGEDMEASEDGAVSTEMAAKPVVGGTVEA